MQEAHTQSYSTYSQEQAELKPFPSYNSNSLTRSRTISISDRSRTSSISINPQSPAKQPSSTNGPYKDHRRRRSSSIISHVEQETFEEENDQQMLPNMNASWVDQPGAWFIHVVVIVLLKIFYELFPGITPIWSWTLTNMTYVVGFYVMFHLIKGTPFDFNGGAYDNLTMWEQIDHETLYTPTRKFLIILPIVLFIISTHYADYDFKFFTFNVMLTTLVGVVPKLPVTHRLRISIPGITGPAQIS